MKNQIFLCHCVRPILVEDPLARVFYKEAA